MNYLAFLAAVLFGMLIGLSASNHDEKIRKEVGKICERTGGEWVGEPWLEVCNYPDKDIGK